MNLSKIKPEQYCKNGDLIIADASEDYEDIGKPIELTNIDGIKIISGLHTILLRDNSKNTVLGFKGYYFSNPKLKKQIKIIANGISVLGIGKNDLSKISIKIPCKSEQEKIVKFIFKIDKKIIFLKSNLDNCQKFKKYLLQNLFPKNNESAPKLRFKQENGENYLEWKDRKLNEILVEHKEKSTGNEDVYSVSVYKGLVNQVEHLGRRFATKDTSKYNLVKPGDIVYTKSPTGDFPLGIIKQSRVSKNVIVSPLYGVFTPETKYLGYILNDYFESSVNTYNYLHPIVQKGAKNTMNISNKTFLSRSLMLPIDFEEQKFIANFLFNIDKKINLIKNQIDKMDEYKKGLLQQMFV